MDMIRALNAAIRYMEDNLGGELDLEQAAKKCGVHFLNAGAFVTADPADGIHMNEAGQALLAEKMTEKVLEILK